MCSDSCDLNVVLLITQMWFEKVRKGIILLKVSAIGASPCHGGVVKGRCVVMGKPHPSHPFTKPHPMVYEPARTTQKFLSMDEILANEKSMFASWRDSLWIPSYESICVGFWRFPKGSLSSQWSSPEVISLVGIISSASLFDEGLSLKNFIRDSWVDGGGDFIQHEGFQALPKWRRSQKLGQHRSLYISQIVINDWKFPSPRPHRRCSQRLLPSRTVISVQPWIKFDECWWLSFWKWPAAVGVLQLNHCEHLGTGNKIKNEAPDCRMSLDLCAGAREQCFWTPI